MTNYYYQIACTTCGSFQCTCKPSLQTVTTTGGNYYYICGICFKNSCVCLNTYPSFVFSPTKPKTMKEIIEQFLKVLDNCNLDMVQLNADEIGQTKVFKIIVKEKE